VIAVQSVVVDGQTIVAQPPTVPGDPPQFGWVLADDRIEIVQYTGSLAPYVVDYAPYYYGAGGARFTFTRGFSNVVLTYTAGFAHAGGRDPTEAASVPATPGPYTIQSQDFFLQDIAVTYANGTALTKVASGPIAGQYAVGATGLYTFAAADQGAAVLLSYGYAPSDIEQAVLELVAWRYKATDRTGVISHSVGARRRRSRRALRRACRA